MKITFVEQNGRPFGLLIDQDAGDVYVMRVTHAKDGYVFIDTFGAPVKDPREAEVLVEIAFDHDHTYAINFWVRDIPGDLFNPLYVAVNKGIIYYEKLLVGEDVITEYEKGVEDN